MTDPNQPPMSQRSLPRRSKKPQLVALAILVLVGVVGLSYSAHDSAQRRVAHALPNPAPATADSIASGKSSYSSHCASCHGEAGDGKGDKAQGLWSKPTDFRDPRLNRRTDGDLYWITTKGSWPMPAFQKKLSDTERWQIIDYIRTFAQHRSP